MKVCPQSVRSVGISVLCALVYLALAAPISAQTVGPQPRINQSVDLAERITLKGNVYPLARKEFDRGAAPSDLPMDRMFLILKRSPEQESALQQLLDGQQDKGSPNFHQWLTPEQFGQVFGPADQDIQAVTGWLQSQGFQVNRVSKGRMVIEFSGTANQVQNAFHTAMHQYAVNGASRYANATDPEIPAALAPVVAGVNTLHNFPLQNFAHTAGAVSRSKATGMFTSAAQPLFTIPGNGGCGVQNQCYGVGPYDFATIYNVLPLWTASPAINGTGQTIAVVGESDINVQDVTDFRNFFGLPAANLQIIHSGTAPGINGAETEADLDVEWSGAVAPGAKIAYVSAASTETSLGVDLAAEYVIDNNLAPILSESFGGCELGLGTAGNQFYNQLWQQASAQGITVLVSTGDSGSAVCDDFNAQPPSPARYGLAVSGFSSTPYNLAVGGTDFYDLTNATNYWSNTNASTTQASALKYIPETTWNDTCTNPVFGTPLLGLSTNPETNCNDSRLIPDFIATVGSSGGKSACTTSNGQTPTTCAGGYAKPSWQTSLTPGDSKRDVPDVSLFSGIGSPSGSFLIVCAADQITSGSSCNPSDPSTQFLSIGGTSGSAPAMAGIMALITQKVGGRVGNPNYVLYKLAGQQTNSSCNSTNGSGSTCVFNDITTGTIAMPCAKGSPNCTTAVTSHTYGVLSGYATSAGYDLATGLGSVNAANLVSKWAAVTLTPSVTTLTNLTPTTITHGQSVSATIGVAPQSGAGVPTGTVSLITSQSTNDAGIGSFILNNGTATGSTTSLPGGTYTVKAHYAGDGTFAASDSTPISLTVNKENSTVQVGLLVINISNGHVTGITPGVTATYGSPYFLRADVKGSVCPSTTLADPACPTGNVTITDNGSSLDGGTLALNSEGYFEDQLIQLTGGTHAIQVNYAGDNSFNASNVTTQIVITPGVTTVTAPTTPTPMVGEPIGFSATVQTNSTGVAPTGTVTFLANGTPLTGSLTTHGTPATSTAPASLDALIVTTLTTAGTKMLTAKYSGDSNYAPATSAATTLEIKFPVPEILLTPSSQTVQAGSNATLTANVVTINNTTLPTGTVSFINELTNVAVPGNVVYTPTTDVNHNVVLQASLAFAPTYTSSYRASYSGDSNYPANQSYTHNTVTVNGSDFDLYAGPPGTAATTQGGQAGIYINVGGQSTYSGTVTFSPSSCSGLPAEASCIFTPASITGPGSIALTINTKAPHQVPRAALSSSPATLLATIFGLPMLGFLLLGVPSRQNKGQMIALCILPLLITLASCGGGGGSSGGGGGGGGKVTDPGTPKGTYTVTVTGTGATVTHTTTFQLVVQ